MSAVLYNLSRDRDPSGVSGTGPSVATIVEFESGLTAMHWNSDTPSVTVHTDIRHIEQINGHGGASILVLAETRLEGAYRLVMPYLLAGDGNNPHVCAPHPDHPDRLRMVFSDAVKWARWIALLDGSTFAASHEDTGAGEMRHAWITPSGDIWLEWYHRLPNDDNPLDTYDKEDR